jgi:hypothetical protein
MYSAGVTLAGGLPHSEIRASKGARPSARLIAACHVLHRLSVPRHPPDALTLTLDRFLDETSGSEDRGRRTDDRYASANHSLPRLPRRSASSLKTLRERTTDDGDRTTDVAQPQSAMAVPMNEHQTTKPRQQPPPVSIDRYPFPRSRLFTLSINTRRRHTPAAPDLVSSRNQYPVISYRLFDAR